MFEQYEDLLSVEEACEALKVGRNTLYALMNSGDLKAYRSGRVWKIPRIALQEFVMRRCGITRK